MAHDIKQQTTSPPGTPAQTLPTSSSRAVVPSTSLPSALLPADPELKKFADLVKAELKENCRLFVRLRTSDESEDLDLARKVLDRNRAILDRTAVLNELIPGLFESKELHQLIRQTSRKEKNIIKLEQSQTEKESGSLADRLTAQIQTAKSNLNEAVEITAIAYYGGATGQLETAGTLIEELRRETNKKGSSILGSNDEFASGSIIRNSIRANPAVSLISGGIQTSLGAVNETLLSGRTWSYNTLGEGRTDPVSVAEYQAREDTDIVLKSAKISTKIGVAAAATAVTIGVSGAPLASLNSLANTEGLSVASATAGKELFKYAGKQIAIAGGMGLAGSTAQELYGSQELGGHFDTIRLLDNAISGAADSMLFMAGIGAASRALSSASLASRFKQFQNYRAAGDWKSARSVIASMRKSKELIGSGVQAIDLIDGTGDAADTIKMWHEAKNGLQFLATGIQGFVNLTDTTDISLSGSIDFLKGRRNGLKHESIDTPAGISDKASDSSNLEQAKLPPTFSLGRLKGRTEISSATFSADLPDGKISVTQYGRANIVTVTDALFTELARRGYDSVGKDPAIAEKTRSFAYSGGIAEIEQFIPPNSIVLRQSLGTQERTAKIVHELGHLLNGLNETQATELEHTLGRRATPSLQSTPAAISHQLDTAAGQGLYTRNELTSEGTQQLAASVELPPAVIPQASQGTLQLKQDQTEAIRQAIRSDLQQRMNDVQSELARHSSSEFEARSLYQSEQGRQRDSAAGYFNFQPFEVSFEESITQVENFKNKVRTPLGLSSDEMTASELALYRQGMKVAVDEMVTFFRLQKSSGVNDVVLDLTADLVQRTLFQTSENPFTGTMSFAQAAAITASVRRSEHLFNSLGSYFLSSTMYDFGFSNASTRAMTDQCLALPPPEQLEVVQLLGQLLAHSGAISSQMDARAKARVSASLQAIASETSSPLVESYAQMHLEAFAIGDYLSFRNRQTPDPLLAELGLNGNSRLRPERIAPDAVVLFGSNGLPESISRATPHQLDNYLQKGLSPATVDACAEHFSDLAQDFSGQKRDSFIVISDVADKTGRDNDLRSLAIAVNRTAVEIAPHALNLIPAPASNTAIKTGNPQGNEASAAAFFATVAPALSADEWQSVIHAARPRTAARTTTNDPRRAKETPSPEPDLTALDTVVDILGPRLAQGCAQLSSHLSKLNKEVQDSKPNLQFIHVDAIASDPAISPFQSVGSALPQNLQYLLDKNLRQKIQSDTGVALNSVPISSQLQFLHYASHCSKSEYSALAGQLKAHPQSGSEILTAFLATAENREMGGVVTRFASRLTDIQCKGLFGRFNQIIHSAETVRQDLVDLAGKEQAERLFPESFRTVVTRANQALRFSAGVPDTAQAFADTMRELWSLNREALALAATVSVAERSIAGGADLRKVPGVNIRGAQGSQIDLVQKALMVRISEQNTAQYNDPTRPSSQRFPDLQNYAHQALQNGLQDPNSQFFVMTLNGDPVQFLRLKPETDPKTHKPLLYIGSVNGEPITKGLRVGGKFFAEAIKEYGSENDLALHVWDLGAARSMYERFGFRYQPEGDVTVRDGARLLYMVRPRGPLPQSE